MTVQFHDPRAEPLAPPEPYRLCTRLDSSLTIGLLANGFPDSVNFLNEIGEALRERWPHLSLRHYDKGDPSTLCAEETLDEIATQCDAVVAAYGH